MFTNMIIISSLVSVIDLSMYGMRKLDVCQERKVSQRDYYRYAREKAMYK